MKLNLGSGGTLLKSYINIDIQGPCDLKHDLRESLPYADGSVEEVWADDVIQHFSRAEWSRVKKDWVRVLQPGGKMEIICRDFEHVLKEFLNCKDNSLKWGWRLQCIYAGQDHEYDYFKNGFTYDKLVSDLKEEGMTNFERDLNDKELIHLICYKPD